MKATLVLMAAVLAIHSFADQASDAQAALEQKKAARDKARAEIVQITAGELEDMRAKIHSLQAQVDALRGDRQSSQSTPKHYDSIELGMTKAEVQQFVRQHDPYMSIVGIHADTGVRKSQSQVRVQNTGHTSVVDNTQVTVRKGGEGTNLTGTGKTTQVDGSGQLSTNSEGTRNIEVTTNTGKTETIEIAQWSFSREQVGSETGSFGQVHAKYGDVTHRTGTISVTLTDDVVTNVDAGDSRRHR